jgi:hypothetical protein
MKIHSTFLNISLSMAMMSPQLSHAQFDIPLWMQPDWIQEKIMAFHARNSERYAQSQAQAQAAANTGTSSNANTNTIVNANSSSSTNKTWPKANMKLAPVETAVPVMNEKYLSKEELRELRNQLKQNH